MKYLGHLSQRDPLYGYLRYDILSSLGVNGGVPEFRVHSVPASNHVYFYDDRQSRTRLVGKFFGGVTDRSPEAASRRMEREFNNLHHLRRIGFTGYPHYVVRPLGHSNSLNCLLVEEFCHGTPFNDFVVMAIRGGVKDTLFRKLTALAYFLAAFHNRTAMDDRVDFGKDCAYFDQIMAQLNTWGHVRGDEAQELYWLRDRWREQPCMWEDGQVLVHGDVTPTNILFGDGLWVIAIDLERMKRADRVFDVGRAAGEIKHLFMLHAGDGNLAEPFIGHFLWEYACHFPDREKAFAAITRRVPFHIGLTLLRIARNSWIDGKYRRRLLDEAKKTLRHVAHGH